MTVTYVRYKTEESASVRRSTTVTFELEGGIVLSATIPDPVQPEETTAAARQRVKDAGLALFADTAERLRSPIRQQGGSEETA